MNKQLQDELLDRLVKTPWNDITVYVDAPGPDDQVLVCGWNDEVESVFWLVRTVSEEAGVRYVLQYQNTNRPMTPIAEMTETLVAALYHKVVKSATTPGIEDEDEGYVPDVTIHPLNGHFLVACDHAWVLGAYSTEEAASLAVDVDPKTLRDLWESKLKSMGPDNAILTLEDVQGALK